MRLLVFFLSIAIVGCTNGQPKVNQPAFKIPPPLGNVSDYEKSFSSVEEYRIDSIIQLVNRRGKVQIGFATFDNTYISDSLFRDYSLAIANAWGVGDKDKNNGILICVSLSMRNIQIRTGLGIEKAITDDMVRQVIDSVIIPNFNKQEYTTGICAGIVALGEMADLTNK